jgi:hypothetical protein
MTVILTRQPPKKPQQNLIEQHKSHNKTVDDMTRFHTFTFAFTAILAVTAIAFTARKVVVHGDSSVRLLV